MTSKWEPVIGLEIHVQLRTNSKAFSSSAVAFGAPPNSLTDPLVLGLPGSLPVLNRTMVEYALRLALATGCSIRPVSRFARKHYFYPDLPKGYQISQYDEPLAEHGRIEIQVGGDRGDSSAGGSGGSDGSSAGGDGQPGGDRARIVRLRRIHLEEDAGKSLHQPGKQTSEVDLNRAGVPLVEVVTEPDIRSAEEATECMRVLRQLVRYLGISDGNMEEGSLRCDANVSLRPAGAGELGTKAELKNLNSFKFVAKAIEFEIARQAALLEAGSKVIQETRLWDSEHGTSHAMRSKEEAHDYRYFPDPDLPPLQVDEAWVERVRSELPELPAARRARLVSEYRLPPADARVLTEERALADYFEETVRAGSDAKRAANWIQTALLHELNREQRSIDGCPIEPADLAELVRMVDTGTISGKIAKDVFAKMYAAGESPRNIVEREGLTQVSDSSAIETASLEIIRANPKEVALYQSGKSALLGFFVGRVMKAMKGRANPGLVNDTLTRLLARQDAAAGTGKDKDTDKDNDGR
ncbi:MAG: Asp-tRNA(Asn)/Glu-tRNA(Gln) amidotransferase subunit GatB [Pseudomonadota bacterium]